MKNEIIGTCPGCYNSQKDSRMVDIYVERNEQGDIENIYIFGDDDFDMPSRNCNITEIKVSEDGKTITEIVCPRCKERIAVEIPVIKKPEKVESKKPDFESLYRNLKVRASE